MPDALDYPVRDTPHFGAPVAVAPGVQWLRMPLPFRLDHINLWWIDDGHGTTLVDCGIDRREVRDAWQNLWRSALSDRPPSRLIVTHFHPDHIGLAGWLCERFDLQPWMTHGEWMMGHFASHNTDPRRLDGRAKFFAGHGADAELFDEMDALFRIYAKQVAPVPTAFHRIADGDRLSIGDIEWQVIIGSGHSPEHACLYAPSIRTLIAGDMVLPKITTNVGVWDSQPDANALGEFLSSLDRLCDLPDDVLVLPSHGRPFRGLHARIDALHHHHSVRLDQTLESCAQPASALDLTRVLFRADLEPAQTAFAMSEALAHLHYLWHQGHLTREIGVKGTIRFHRIQ